MAVLDNDDLKASGAATVRCLNAALARISRRLCHEEMDLDAALSFISEIGARALDVQRVNVWRFDPDGMRCLHGVELTPTGLLHNPPGYDEVLRIDQSAYAEALPEARVVLASDVEKELAISARDEQLAAYLRRHGIQSLLDSPVHVGEGMYGVICHEFVGANRQWSADEIAFAGNMGDFVALAVEIDRRRRAEAQLDYLAYHDPVTGRANRRYLLTVLKRELQRMQHGQRLSALLFIDSDRFRSVNARDGESMGDAVLSAMGAKLEALIPKHAFIARVESDCFGVLLPDISHEWEATQLASRLLEGFADADPFDTDHPGMPAMSASIGIAFADEGSAPSADAWLADADAACRIAKEAGRGRFEVFDAEHHQELMARWMMEVRLREAFRQDEFEVHYQPEIDTETARVIAAEALLRWRDGSSGLRIAADFIDVAEDSGLIVPIGRWVLQEACRVAVGWEGSTAAPAPTLRVNLSARQFEQIGLADMVAGALATTGLPPHRLCLEITETTLMTRAESALTTLNQLRELGVSLAIDDFGTGYSSLAYLKRFPVDTVKIDRSFVVGLPDNRFDLAIVQAMLGLTRTLGLDVVAEGVEHPAQAEVLRKHGITRVQGWLYAKAMPPDDLEAMIARGYAGEGSGSIAASANLSTQGD